MSPAGGERSDWRPPRKDQFAGTHYHLGELLAVYLVEQTKSNKERLAALLGRSEGGIAMLWRQIEEGKVIGNDPDKAHNTIQAQVEYIKSLFPERLWRGVANDYRQNNLFDLRTPVDPKKDHQDQELVAALKRLASSDAETAALKKKIAEMEEREAMTKKKLDEEKLKEAASKKKIEAAMGGLIDFIDATKKKLSEEEYHDFLLEAHAEFDEIMFNVEKETVEPIEGEE